MKPEWRDNAELNKRLIEWSKTGAGQAVAAKEWQVQRLQREGKTIEAANLRNEVLAESTKAAQQIMRDLNGTDSKKRT